MSHPGSVDIIDFVLLTIYPVGGLFIIEILSRIISKTGKPVPSWLKLSIQGITMVGFAVAYTVFLPFFVYVLAGWFPNCRIKITCFEFVF